MYEVAWAVKTIKLKRLFLLRENNSTQTGTQVFSRGLFALKGQVMIAQGNTLGMRPPHTLPPLPPLPPRTEGEGGGEVSVPCPQGVALGYHT